MAIINMTETCKANGISEFGRTRGGWIKMVEGIDKTKKGGYSFIGDNFFKAGNFKTNFPNGIYLDQSTDKEKNLTMNLFSIENGNVTLVNTTPKTDGWAEELWDDVDKYFHTQTEVTAQDIINTIHEMTEDENLIAEVITKLQDKQTQEESHYPFKNWYEVKSILCDIECFETPLNTIEELSEEKPPKFIFKCDELPSHFAYKKWITTIMNLINHTEINEETIIDYKEITVNTFKSKFFKNEIKNKEAHYLARTVGNNTGYHNSIKVTIFYYENNVLCIREFRYFMDTYKLGQITDEILTPNWANI